MKLVICGCTKNKRKGPEIAKNLYLGDIFEKVLKYTSQNGLEFMILSAKYGLLTPESIIEAYDLRLTGKKQAQQLLKEILHNQKDLVQHILTFDQIEIIMGQKYENLILDLLKVSNYSGKVFLIRKNNGIFDFKKNLKLLIDSNTTDWIEVGEKK